jgi:hypothetical protein
VYRGVPAWSPLSNRPCRILPKTHHPTNVAPDGTPRGFGQTGVDYKDGYEATATEDTTITVSGGAEPPANEL